MIDFGAFLLPVAPFECEALGVKFKVDELDLGVVLPLTGMVTLSAKLSIDCTFGLR